VAGTLHEITWDPTGTCGAYVEIELLRAGVLCGTIAAAAQNRGSYAWTAAQCEDYPDHYSVRVTDAASGARDESDRTFQIPSACSVSLLSPNGFESWPEGTVHDITWSRTGICSFVRIELLRLGIACKTIAYSTDNDGRYTWVVDRCLDYADQYTVRITDLATGAMDVSSQPFTIPARLPAAPGESRPE
jgi:hypothetical protein